MTAARDQLTGRTLGDFVVRDKLGEGGFGAVYRAEQPLLQREAVIKVLLGRHRARENVIQRFLREARLASQLDHPYAAHVYAFGAEPDGLLWIAMELVRGTPLDKLVRSQGPLPLERLVPLMDRICEVVHTAHEQGIVHRDIKPANVIVLSRAGRILPKLLDFGIAKVAAHEVQRDSSPIPVPDSNLAFEATLSESAVEASRTPVDAGTSHLTQQGALVGSPRYMAPEQWVDASAADARADIYALGVLAYETLTGKPPFDGRTLFEVAQAHAEGAVPPVGDGFPAALDAVFARALAKTASERYASALELAVAFREASGLAAETREPLPQLDESLRDTLIADAPQPIAEAVAALAAAHNAHQLRDAIRVLVRVAVRIVGLVALACRTRIGVDGRDAEPVLEALRALRRRTLADDEWLELARELCRPYAARPDVFPIPELVTLFFGDMAMSRESPLDESLAVPARGEVGASEDQVRELVTRSLPELARFLRSIAFLADYPLVVWRGDRAESWIGVRRPKRAALATRGKPLASDQPALVDRDGHPVLSLWPLAQIGPPSPGAPDELFLFDGKGRHGARFVAMPQDFERQDEALWEWFGDALLDTIDEAGAAPTEQPYRGLAAFTTADAALFFGREREVDAFVNRLRAQSLIAVVGPSGAGKSSFVQAGVIPSLPAAWRAITVRPGPSPLAAIGTRLSQELGEVIDVAVADLDALGERVRAHARATGATLVVVVDQLEELFTLCLDVDHRARYADVLAHLARSAEDPVRVICTLRDDFLLAAERLAPLRARLAHGLQLVSTPARDDLLRIVSEPARRAGYDFEDRELPAQMVDAVVDHPGALALLAFSATKLWQLRDRHFKQLGRRAYEAMGGVGGALAQHAETTIGELSSDEQRLVREAFRHLVTAEGTRAVLARHELLQVLGGGPRAAVVVERLIAARLLVAAEGEGGEERVEVIHEALLAAWPRLVEWRREDAEGARLRDQLRAAARQWEERGRPRSLLWRDETLTEYQLWRARHPGALTALETAFTGASIRESNRIRRARRMLVIGAFAALSIGVAILIRLNQEARDQRALAEERGEDAHRNADIAKRRVADLYLEQGRVFGLNNDPMRALVHLAQAAKEGAHGPALDFLIGWTAQQFDGQLARFDAGAPLSAIDMSADGRRVATGTTDGHASIWDVGKARVAVTLVGHTGRIWQIRFAGAGVVTASADGTARSWDAATGAALHVLDHGAPIVDLAVDARTIATAGDAPTVKLWDATTGALRATLPGHKPSVWACALDPTGEFVATGDGAGAVRIWRTADGRLVRTLAAHAGRVTRVAFAPKTRVLATAGFDDGHARVWNLETGAQIAAVRHRAPQVRSVAFDSTGGLLATASEDRTAKIAALPGGVEQLTVDATSPVRVALFEPRGNRVLTTSFDGGVRSWDATTGTLRWSFLGHGDDVRQAAFAATGARFATASADGSAQVWGLGEGERVVLGGHHGAVWSAAFSPDGTMIVTAAEDGHARIWRMPEGRLAYSIDAEMSAYGTAVFSPDNRRVAVAGPAGASIHDVLGGHRIATLAGAVKVTSLAYSPAGDRIAIGTEDGSLGLWDASTGAVVRSLGKHDKEVWSVAFSPDGSLIASAGQDTTTRVWTVATGKLVHTLAHDAYVASATFTADGKRIVTAGKDRLVRIWDVARGTVLDSFEAGTSTISTAEMSRDQRYLLTASHDGRARIWDLATQQQIANVDVQTDVYFSAHYRSDGRAAVVSARGFASVWMLPATRPDLASIEQLIACRIPSRYRFGTWRAVVCRR